MDGFRRSRENLVYENRWIELFDDEVIGPGGTPGRYVRLQYRGNPPGVVIVPRTPQGRLLLLEIERYAAGRRSLEFPRGCVRAGEGSSEGAERELLEETGVRAESLEWLGAMHPDTAIVATKVDVWVARTPPLAVSDVAVEAAEGIVAARFLYDDEVRELVREGVIVDGFTLAALAMLAANDQTK